MRFNIVYRFQNTELGFQLFSEPTGEERKEDVGSWEPPLICALV